MSLNEIKKEFQFAGKGHNVIFEMAIPVKHTSAATNSVDGHVSENGGTCQFTKLCQSDRRECQWIAFNVKRTQNQLEQVMIRLCENIDCCALFSIFAGRLTDYRYLWSVTMLGYYVCDVVVTQGTSGFLK